MIKGTKLGITEWGLPAKMQGPVACKLAKDVGLDGLELSLGEAEDCFPLANDYVIDAYKEARAEHGVEFSALAVNMTDFFPMTAPKGDAGRKLVEYALRLGIDCAARLDIPLLQVPSFLASRIDNEDALRNTVECFQAACDHAADKGIIVSTENSLSVEMQLRELELVNRKNFKVYFDTQNYFLNCGYHEPDLVPPLAKHIVEVHVKDGVGDISNRLVGEGENHVFETLRALFDNGYKGWLVLENYYSKQPLCNHGDDFVALLKKDVAIVNGWLEKNT